MWRTLIRIARRVWLAPLFLSLGLLGACGESSDVPLAYRVGGTVSGLIASGLVLANGSDTVSVAANAATFNLPTFIAAGSTYTVTVKNQPAGQVCSVTNGSGTIGTAYVANVVVACSDQSFTLSGTVSGLTASGLVLANGSDTLEVSASATTFTLPTAVALGSSYAVTVKTQPTGLSCAVTQGTGTMPANNVSTVVVTCTDQPFSLGGSISGLSASGLVLTNGSDTLTVESGASNFTMPSQVAFGSQYTVTVHAQPTGLTCTVSNGSGTMPAAAVTNISVVCASQTYSVSGTISGLTTGGLVLANGTDTLTLPSGATSFTLPVQIAVGSQYAVSVQSHPSGLTCSVSNGTGTMSANPVTNVAITCAVRTYTIGGSISGLTATGLVLENGTDTTPSIGATATVFTLPTGLVSGATYNVIVRTQPSGQLCTVSHGSGTVSTSAVTSISISCGTNVVSFTTPGSATWTVPDGVTSLHIVATGAGGGGSYSGRGGSGAVVTATLTVSPGDVLALEVGGGGGATGVDGGGGGSTNVNAGTATQIIAGGGGGGSTYGEGGAGGQFSNGDGSPGQQTGGVFGSGGSRGIGGFGGPGFPSGADNGAPGDNGSDGNGGPGGPGGDGAAGGIGGGSGAGGAGGTPEIDDIAIGGGGGGGFGGGGGGGTGGIGGGGGGGGSTGPAGTVYSDATNGGVRSAGGDGSIVITANP